jgi:hypothetical protein
MELESKTTSKWTSNDVNTASLLQSDRFVALVVSVLDRICAFWFGCTVVQRGATERVLVNRYQFHSTVQSEICGGLGNFECYNVC